MKSARVCLLSLGCVGGAFAFGMVANAAIDLVMPPPPRKAEVAAAKPAEPAQQPVAYALASTTSTPIDIAPVRVKTISIRESETTQPAASERLAAVPLPRPRPASAPAMADGLPIAHQPGSMAISAATRKA